MKKTKELALLGAGIVLSACDMTPQEVEIINRQMRELAAAMESNQPVRPYYQPQRPAYTPTPYPPPAPSIGGAVGGGSGRGCGGVPCGAATCGVF